MNRETQTFQDDNQLKDNSQLEDFPNNKSLINPITAKSMAKNCLVWSSINMILGVFTFYGYNLLYT